MARQKKVYPNGKPRTSFGGHLGNRTKKDYHRQEVMFHGSESAYEKWVDGGRKGYYQSK